MERVIITDDDEVIFLNTDTDTCLYKAPCRESLTIHSTSTNYIRGVDLYAHRDTLGRVYFYLHHWRLGQQIADWIEPIERQQALDFLLEKAKLIGAYSITESEIEKSKEFGFSIQKETA